MVGVKSKKQFKFGEIYKISEHNPPSLTPIWVFYDKMRVWLFCIYDAHEKKFIDEVPKQCKRLYWTLQPPIEIQAINALMDRKE